MIVVLAVGIAIGRTNKPQPHEFFYALPVTRRRLFAGRVLPWLLLVLLVPVASLVRLALQSPDGSGWLAVFANSDDPFIVQRLRALVPVLPETWSLRGISIEHWPRLWGPCAARSSTRGCSA